jgi:hypothetical protein
VNLERGKHVQRFIVEETEDRVALVVRPAQALLDRRGRGIAATGSKDGGRAAAARVAFNKSRFSKVQRELIELMNGVREAARNYRVWKSSEKDPFRLICHGNAQIRI